MSKSRPLYQPLQLDLCGRAHLVVSDLNEIPNETMLGGMPLANLESWVVSVTGRGIQSARPGGKAFRAVADLLQHLAHRLRRADIGLRLYAVGTEAFLWDVNNIARQAGLSDGEIFLTQAGSLRRRVYCAHCKTMNENVTTNIARCRGCAANLFVRDHFSRRLAAFMGVAVDAEVPGEVPAPEVLFP